MKERAECDEIKVGELTLAEGLMSEEFCFPGLGQLLGPSFKIQSDFNSVLFLQRLTQRTIVSKHFADILAQDPVIDAKVKKLPPGV